MPSSRGKRGSQATYCNCASTPMPLEAMTGSAPEEMEIWLAQVRQKYSVNEFRPTGGGYVSDLLPAWMRTRSRHCSSPVSFCQFCDFQPGVRAAMEDERSLVLVVNIRALALVHWIWSAYPR